VDIANELQTASEWLKERRHGPVPATTSPTHERYGARDQDRDVGRTR
jgi:hypothetical protein